MSYCTRTEFVSEPYPYRTLIKFPSRNSQKLFDRGYKLNKILIERGSLYQKIYIEHLVVVVLFKLESLVKVGFGSGTETNSVEVQYFVAFKPNQSN